MSRILTLEHMDKWAEIMHNKPLHHQSLNIYSKYTHHIPPVLSTFGMVSKHCLLILRIATSPIFCPPTTSHHIPPLPPTMSHHLHTLFNLPTPPHMPAKLKKTTQADLQKCQVLNTDKQLVKRSRHGVQNNDKDNDNNQGDTTADQWADHEDQAMKTKGRGGRGGESRMHSQKVHMPIIDGSHQYNDCHQLGMIST